MADEKLRSDKIDDVWDLMEKIGFCMMVTREGEDLRSRPMAAYCDRRAGEIYFLTDVDSHKDADIESHPRLNLAFADNSAMNYVSLSGKAVVSNDRAKIKELWGTPAKAWWDSPDDPSLRVLKITPSDAHYWNGAAKPVAYIKMAMAAVSGSKPDMGESDQVQM